MNTIEIRPSTIGDALEYCGHLPCYRAKSWTAIKDGKIIALGGFGYHPGGYAVIFLHSDSVAQRAHKVTLCRMAMKVLGEARKTGRKIIAQCDSQIQGAEKLLLWLGFSRCAGEIFEYRGVE